MNNHIGDYEAVTSKKEDMSGFLMLRCYLDRRIVCYDAMVRKRSHSKKFDVKM